MLPYHYFCQLRHHFFIKMANYMKVFDGLTNELLHDPASDKGYLEIFPLCNVSISLQALYLSHLIMALRKAFYPHYDFRIGIIGCGNVGSLLLRTLTDLSGVKPFRIMVSTRRPETLATFQRDGVYVCSDNQKVCMPLCSFHFITPPFFRLSTSATSSS